MTTGHSPSSGDYDATTALSRFASPQDLERIAETRPDLHSILAANPSIPPRVRAILERSEDAIVQEVLARQAGRGAQQAQPAQPPVPGQIGPMAPTMAAGTAGTPPPQQVPAGSGYGQVPQGYGITQPSTAAAPPQGTSTQGTTPQGYGTTGASLGDGPGPAQAYPGQAYGPNQAAAPAYGAPMYAPPAQAPRKRRLLKVLAVALPVALVLGAGGVAAWFFLWRSNVYATSQYITLSDSWKNGATKAWSADVTSGVQPYVIGNHFLTLDRSNGTLTGYTPLSSEMKEAWHTTLDDEELSSSYGYPPSFQAWGDNTLVYKSTLVDLKSGDTSKAPWGDDSSATIAGDTAISCKEGDKCTAWDVNKKQKWSREIDGSGESSGFPYVRNVPVLVRNGRHYVTLYNVVINVDNGETLILGGGSKADSDLSTIYFEDGWGTLEEEKKSDSDSDSSSTTRYKVTIYDFEGKKQSNHQEIMPTDKRAITGDNEILTAEQHRAYFKDKDYSNASLTATNNSDGCVSKLTPKKGDSITVPQPKDNGDSSYDSEAPECPSGAATSENGGVVKLATWKRGDTNEIQMLMNVKTGKEITFSGIDWKSGDSLIVAGPDLIIGYHKEDGKVTGFKPAS